MVENTQGRRTQSGEAEIIVGTLMLTRGRQDNFALVIDGEIVSDVFYRHDPAPGDVEGERMAGRMKDAGVSRYRITDGVMLLNDGSRKPIGLLGYESFCGMKRVLNRYSMAESASRAMRAVQ